MFSLIITLVSIGLVVLLAVATIYYGGSSFNNSGPQARAAQVVNEGAQLKGAYEFYKVEHAGNYPETLQTLVDDKYLSGIPQNDWTVEDNFITVSGLSEDECLRANTLQGLDSTTVPACDDPSIQGRTACCEVPEVTP